MSYLIRRVLAKPRLILDEMCRLYGKFASYLRRVLCKTRLIFPRINGPNVYLISDKDKSRARDRYIVVSIDFPWCFVKKFSGSQLRASSYKVKLSECYATSPSVIVSDHSGPPASQDQDDEPSPVTPAVPAASVSPESPPPAPPELTSVPSDAKQFPSSTCDDTTLDAPFGVPSLPVLQEEPSTSATAPDQALPSCPSSSPETPGPRPQRQRKHHRT